jgi:hypothetical protein
MKGSILDLPIILVILLVGAITVFLVYYVLTAVYSVWPSTTAAELQSKQLMARGIEAYTIFDQMIVVLSVGLGMFSVMSGFLIDSHPMFFIITALLLLPIIIYTSAVMTNVFDMFATTDAMISVSNTFPYTVILMRNLPLFSLILGAFIAIATHAKSGSRIQGY